MKNNLLTATTGHAGFGKTKEQNALCQNEPSNGVHPKRFNHFSGTHHPSSGGLSPSLTLYSWKCYLQRI